MDAYISIDQGTTSSRAILFGEDGTVLNSFQEEFKQIYPKPGWVEHDPEEIWETTKSVLSDLYNSEIAKKNNLVSRVDYYKTPSSICGLYAYWGETRLSNSGSLLIS